ncbi:alpha, alpha-trehalose-phosphate synthase 2 (trehalose-6-phosphate UDP-glucose phosphate glucosyltransferase) tpsB [Aspergillus leporis]|uniref:alpha,alpha-trehalose-phosphate synthase (UDP-forming) n=1 Tax=Aspergillus leporis TaxID=41062 RepID=A0A5N5WN83_9EURO|nr:alpha, alpha-trehalose-phosphate synthase 2 (trehalose-6-phosphate UDP-glucose phosphate glucosyltransferase) tpsB [Aspergillus leporis]
MAPPPSLIIVSNRLPITIKKLKTGSYECSQSTGGLAGALGGLAKSMPFRWFGWPGLEIPQEDEELVRQKTVDYDVLPIFLDNDLANKYYNGFSNSTLWPLFHYQLHEMGRIDKADWDAYVEVNLLFAKVITSQLNDGDSIWIHDYHLMLLPQFLRESTRQTGMKVKIGFFLHTPFPSCEVYRILPMRKKILTALLHCDLVGFHTESYARHFLCSCSEILKLPTSSSHAEFQCSNVAVGVFPIGIQPERFAETIQKHGVQERIRDLSRRYQGAKLIVSVDRLDYIKGVPQKLHALETFLTQYPEWVGKVVLMQVAVPTREDVEEYQSLKAEVNELVGRLNGKHGSIEFSPVSFLYRSLDFEEIVALYAASDVCLVSSTRDGMNLVSLEYIASQRLKHGSLVLSEFTGAAEVLDGGIIFNPWDVEESVDAIHGALTMGEEERAKNFKKLEEYVMRNTSAAWGKKFTDCLMKA